MKSEKAEGPHACGTTGVPAHDRDADDFVEPTRQNDPADRGAAVRGRERERLRPAPPAVKRRPQPYALRAWARRRSSPAATSKPGFPLASGQEVVAK